MAVKNSTNNNGRKKRISKSSMTLLKNRKKTTFNNYNTKDLINPFDRKQNASTHRHHVLNRKVRGESRNVAVSRSKADTRRKSTLLKQFQDRSNVNVFQDKRLGAYDADMSYEDKMLARFTQVRKRMTKITNRKFQLNDDEEEDEGEFLTHKGTELMKDDYDSLNNVTYSPFNDSDDDGDQHLLRSGSQQHRNDNELGREVVEQLHFGGGMNNSTTQDGDKPAALRTHKEIMQEVIAKSKFFKAEKQKNKAVQEDTTDKLDEDFKSIQNLLNFRPKKGEECGDKKIKVVKEKMDEYDRMTRELTFEAKAKASERKVTPEELAQKEKEKLAELEKKRLIRMLGDEDGGGKKKKCLPLTDDDVGLEYQVNQSFAVVSSGDEGGEELSIEGEEDDDSTEEEIESDGDEGESSAESIEELVALNNNKESIKPLPSSSEVQVDTEIPYVLPCPQSLHGLIQLFTKYKQSSDSRTVSSETHSMNIIIERIRKYYSPRLSVENQQKIKTFFRVLMDYFLQLEEEVSTGSCNNVSNLLL